MIRILHVIGKMGSGGAEAMIMNLYRAVDRTRIQFDFVVHTQEKAFYDDEITALGGKIYRASKFNIINYFSYKKFWDNFFKQHTEYQIVHGHINSSAAIYLKSAKNHGRIAVVHSHATKNKEKSIRAIAFLLTSYPIRYIADYFFACSRQAGIDRFGKHVVKSSGFHVLNNGIEAENYRFNQVMRDTIRKKYGISKDCLVVGHVGRFTFAKNHSFLLDFFAEMQQKEPNSVLMLVGTGELEENIRQKAQTLGIEKSVIFIGQTKTVYDYLQAMDVFVFPSIFEGLGIALVEAQAAGLPCLASENIQGEADIGGGLIQMINLDSGSEKWADAALKQRGTERKNQEDLVKKAGFDIAGTAKYMQDFYLNLIRP